ncbi:unnamed protein product, partial [Mesorhabditis belari]|uniref:Uncharacterized protein n=1 Tax=Mesorhabditis belari TaxID=2138241 RepID=A0AAF3FMD2_9BILA
MFAETTTKATRPPITTTTTVLPTTIATFRSWCNDQIGAIQIAAGCPFTVKEKSWDGIAGSIITWIITFILLLAIGYFAGRSCFRCLSQACRKKGKASLVNRIGENGMSVP